MKLEDIQPGQFFTGKGSADDLFLMLSPLGNERLLKTGGGKYFALRVRTDQPRYLFGIAVWTSDIYDWWEVVPPEEVT